MSASREPATSDFVDRYIAAQAEKYTGARNNAIGIVCSVLASNIPGLTPDGLGTQAIARQIIDSLDEVELLDLS
jgi:hypothetical protein